MVDNEVVHRLISWCLEKLNENQFTELKRLVLTPKEQDELTQPVTKASFLGDIERWGYQDKLEEILRKRWPDILSEPLKQLEEHRRDVPTEEPAVVEPISVDFVNRIEEFKTIFQSAMLAQHWIIDAPAGYGKTEFLKEIRERYTKTEGWLCCYVELPREAPLQIRALAHEIIREFGGSENFREEIGARQIGRRIAAYLLNLCVGTNEKICLLSAQYSGIAVFVDNIESLEQETLSGLADLIGGVYEGLNGSGFFNRQNRLRFFLAGRDARRKASSILSERSVPTADMALSPYTFSVVQDTVRQYALKAGVIPPEENLRETSAQLMYLTGGHPGCIAAILQELAKGRFAEAPFVLKEEPEKFNGVVFSVLRDLESASDRRELIPILETLSVFRRYKPWMLRHLLDKRYIHWIRDEYELESALSETYLLEKKEGFLQNDISRRLFAIRFRTMDPDRFRRLCSEGPTLYENYLHSPKPWHPETVVVEWLYQKLQYEYYVEGKRGENLRRVILEATRSALGMLETMWDSREIIPVFADILKEDWELQFMVNYFSSEEGYSDEPYKELLGQVGGKY